VQKGIEMKRAVDFFDEGYACAVSILLVYAEQFDLQEKDVIKIASCFGAGMGRLRKTCGALTGSTMVLGMAFGNSDPKDMKTKLHAYERVRDLFQEFEAKYNTSDCAELLKKKCTDQQIKDRYHHKLICREVIETTQNLLDNILSNS
jgi:C_GCAxxG_C_C family probable redox protein